MESVLETRCLLGVKRLGYAMDFLPSKSSATAIQREDEDPSQQGIGDYRDPKAG